MFGIGTGELLLLLVIALLVLGPERMPKLARDVGKTMADLRKTSDELRSEFLNADKALNAERLLDVAAKQVATPPSSAAPEAPPPSAETAAATQSSVPPDAGATQAEVVTAPEMVTDHEETAFDREARMARERLEDPEATKEREAQAKVEGWKVPTDEAGTSAREG